MLCRIHQTHDIDGRRTNHFRIDVMQFIEVIVHYQLRPWLLEEGEEVVDVVDVPT